MNSRLAIVASHPIQHFCPLYAYLADQPDLDLDVIFGVRGGASGYLDPGFGHTVEWAEVLYLDRFQHTFLSDGANPSDESRLAYRSVIGRLNELDPTVVVIYGLHRRVSRAAYVWALRHGRRLVYISDSEDRGDSNRNLRRTKRAIMSLAFVPISRFFAVGDANEHYYLGRGVQPSRLRRVPFPVDRDRYGASASSSDRESVRLQLGLDASDILVLTVGKLVPRKRQVDLVTALSLVHDDRLVLAVVGSGSQGPEISRIASELGVRVIEPGFVAPIDLPPWYMASDIYADVSDRDPHPLAVSEAVFSGLPCIVSDVIGSHGPSDDVRPWVNGLVARVGDVTSMANALERLSSDHERRSSFSDASRRIGRGLQRKAYDGFADAVRELDGRSRR